MVRPFLSIFIDGITLLSSVISELYTGFYDNKTNNLILPFLLKGSYSRIRFPITTTQVETEHTSTISNEGVSG